MLCNPFPTSDDIEYTCHESVWLCQHSNCEPGHSSAAGSLIKLHLLQLLVCGLGQDRVQLQLLHTCATQLALPGKQWINTRLAGCCGASEWRSGRSQQRCSCSDCDSASWCRQFQMLCQLWWGTQHRLCIACSDSVLSLTSGLRRLSVHKHLQLEPTCWPVEGEGGLPGVCHNHQGPVGGIPHALLVTCQHCHQNTWHLHKSCLLVQP